jgi:ubiquinone/menaquinone biosynthesis C-methylase UbiE
MPVTIEKTAKKYRGKKAETYDEIRMKQQRWDQENENVERMLSVARSIVVLDCPAGTGRFIKACADVGVREYYGVDVSEEMLALARKKVKKSKMSIILDVGDARHQGDKRPDTTLCIRFLDLIDEEAMYAVMKEMMRVTSKNIIFTIRLGDKYVPKSNTAEHDAKKLRAFIKKAGWRIAEEVPVFNAGWTIMRIEK